MFQIKTKMSFLLIIAFVQIVPSSSKSQHRQLSVSVPAGELIHIVLFVNHDHIYHFLFDKFAFGE